MRITTSFLAGAGAALLLTTAAAELWAPTLVTGATESTAASHLFVKRSEAETHQMQNAVSRIMLTADQTNGRYSVVDEEFKPGMASFSHRHSYHSETFLLLDGRMEWTIGGETKTIGPGDLVYIPPDTPHKTRVLGDAVAHAIMIYEPGGYEHNLRRRVSLTPEQRGDPETMRKMMELADVIPEGSGQRDF